MNQMRHNCLKAPTGRRQPVGYLQVWPWILIGDDREQNQQVAKAGLELGDHRIASPTFLAIGHSASHNP